eukprot:s1600_g19.t1
MPETPILDIDRFPPFVRRLHDLFQAVIHDNPTFAEDGPKIETWFLDHHRMKQCFQARNVHLTPRFEQWEQWILHEWRDHVDQFQPVEFHVVHPHPEDAEDDSVAQLVLHQRPLDGFCSVVLSIYDSAYDDGKPHSYATVLANRVNLEVAAVAAEFDEFCQPLHNPIDCTFWFGQLQIRPYQLVAARHGYAFRLKVRRPLEVDVANWRALNLDDLRDVLSQTLNDAETFQSHSGAMSTPTHAMPVEVIHPVNDTWQPDWIAAIEEAQDRERQNHRINPLEITTWFLNGHQAPRSLFARRINLPPDVHFWESAILNAWNDHVDLHLPCFLHFVDPKPPTTAHDTGLGHILIGPPNDALDMPNPLDPEAQRYQTPVGLNPDAPVFRPRTSSIEDQSETIQDLFVIWEQQAFAWENEEPTADIATWFVDHRLPYPRCTNHRPVRLDRDFSQWEYKILRTWSDLVQPDIAQNMYLVSPQPPQLEPNIIAHIIVVQAEHDDWVSNLVTIFDSFIGHRGRDFVRIVLTTDQRLVLEHVITGCGYTPDSVLPTSLTPCVAWIDGHPLQPGHPWPARSGHCIVLQVYRRVVAMPHSAQATQSPVMVQVGARATQRLPDDVSDQKFQLCLDELVPHDCATSVPAELIPIKLRHLVPSVNLPTEIFIEDGSSGDDIEKELVRWGHQRHVYMLASTGLAVTVPIDWRIQAPLRHLIYCPCQNQNPDEVFFHSSDKHLSELDHMKFLHSLGLTRAVIVTQKMLRSGLELITYHNNVPISQG